MIRGAEGDDDAFGILVGRWEKRVFGFLEYMLGSREEAQDVTQEAFLRMCQSAATYRPSGQFRSWLFRIAGNLARSRLRRRKILRWVRLDPAAWTVPPVFPLIAAHGGVDPQEMHRVFNMGVGMIVITGPQTDLAGLGDAVLVGEVTAGDAKVDLPL